MAAALRFSTTAALPNAGATCTSSAGPSRSRRGGTRSAAGCISGWTPGPHANHYGIERSSDPAASLAAPLPLTRVTPAVEAGDHVHSLVHDPKEQRVRKSSASSAAD